MYRFLISWPIQNIKLAELSQFIISLSYDVYF